MFAPTPEEFQQAADVIYRLAGFSHPQFIPGNPHNLPPDSQRPAQRQDTFIGDTSVINEAPTSGFAGPATKISDAHRYAFLIQGNVPATQLVNAPPFITEPYGKRNFLALRNSSALANIYIAFGQAANADSWLRLAPNESVLFDTVVPQNEVFVFADAANGFVSYAFSTISG